MVGEMLLLCIFLCTAISVGCNVTPIIPDEQRLLDHIFLKSSYNNKVRPVYNASQSVVITTGVTLIMIKDMEERNQVLVTNVWLDHAWIDERIKWDPEAFGGVTALRLPASMLWLPDIVLYNNADDFTDGYMEVNALLDNKGNIMWSLPARLRSSCKVDITYFPFDQQVCQMKFGSWMYDQAQVDIVNKADEVEVSTYITNGEWHLISTSIQRNEVVYPISPAVYPDITIRLLIERRILYYVLNIILPCIMLNLISLLTFCLPPDAGEKVSVGVTILLSYSIFMLLVADNMPPTSEFIPLIGVYLLLLMIVTSLSILCTVWVLRLHHRGANTKPVPLWVKKIIHKIPVMGWHRVPSCHFNAPGDDDDGSPRMELRNWQLQRNTVASSVQVELLQQLLFYVRQLAHKSQEDEISDKLLEEWKEVAGVVDRCMFWLFLIFTTLSTVFMMTILPAI